MIARIRHAPLQSPARSAAALARTFALMRLINSSDWEVAVNQSERGYRKKFPEKRRACFHKIIERQEQPGQAQLEKLAAMEVKQ